MKNGNHKSLYDVIFQSSTKQFQSNISLSNSNRNFKLPPLCIFKRSNLILLLNFQNSGVFISFAMSISPYWAKSVQKCVAYIEDDRKIGVNIWWNSDMGSLFLRSLSQNIAGLTPMVTSLTKNSVKKDPNLYFM